MIEEHHQEAVTAANVSQDSIALKKLVS